MSTQDLNGNQQRPLTVLHVIPSISAKDGGPSYAIRSMAKASRDIGIDVIVATTDDDGNGPLLNVPLSQTRVRDGVTYFFFRRNSVHYKISHSLARWLNRHVSSFDLVCIHALFSFSSYAAARAARRHEIPYIVRPLGVLNRWGLENRRPLIKRISLELIEFPLLRRAAGIHYTSEAEREEAKTLDAALGDSRSFVIPIPVNRLKPGDANAFIGRFPETCGRKVILFLSRIDKKKGLELLLQAFAKAKHANPSLVLAIAGDGDANYIEHLRELARNLDISEEILWCGFLGPEEKADAYVAASMFVLPSHSENFGIAAAEALAAGVPTILSDQVALSREVSIANAAVVVPCDAGAIANAICDLLGNPERCAQLASKGREFASQRLSPAAVGEAMRTEYDRILGTRSAKRDE